MFQRVYLGVCFATVAFAAIACIATSAIAQDNLSSSAPKNGAASQVDASSPKIGASTAESTTISPDKSAVVEKPSNRLAVLIGSLTVFALAVFVGFEVINKVPPTLHTPLMSGSNAISGITVVGAILATGFGKFGFGSLLGAAAIVLAMINVVGGFWVTHRMLSMFKKK
ncbi:MAG: NAD(P) transhydrogenase subunit alpha [Pirellula sp.]|jgi:NAD(P) transhydrogenase subunit alpha|nr:NAD(P) transhydrogenase subunit alpha [Pirellula sp.]